jgi:hypothetical protein
MEKKDLLNYVLPTFEVVLTALQENVTYQIVCMILTIVSFLITIAFTCWKWYRDASKDGRITADEVSDLGDKLTGAVDDAKKQIDNDKEDKKND